MIVGCNKNAIFVNQNETLKEDISISDIQKWANYYKSEFANVPDLDIEKAQKAFINEDFLVRVPVEGSTGFVYFNKNIKLEAVFIRAHKNGPSLNNTFRSLEYIDLNQKEYKIVTYRNNLADSIFTIGEMRQSINVDSDIVQGSGNFWFDLGCFLRLMVPKTENGVRSCYAFSWSEFFSAIANFFGSSGGSFSGGSLTILPPSGGSITLPPLGDGDFGTGGGGGGASWDNPTWTDLNNPFWQNFFSIPVAGNTNKILQISDIVPLTDEMIDFLDQNSIIVDEIYDIISTADFEDLDALKVGIRLTLLTIINNYEFDEVAITNAYNSIHAQNLQISDNPFTRYLTTKYAILKYENSKLPIGQRKSEIRLIYETFSDSIHITLDVLGLIPFGGEIFDVINGFTYTLEGDKANAYLSYASAIPWAGYAASTAKVVKAGSVIIAVAQPSGKLIASRVTQGVFRRACGAVGSQVGHHIIPFHKFVQEHPIMQMAFRAGFDPNNASVNGKAIEGALNTGNHTAYANKVKKALDDIQNQFPNLKPQEAKQKLIELTNRIKSIIDANTGVHVDNLPF